MIRCSIWALPFNKIGFSQLNTASTGIVPYYPKYDTFGQWHKITPSQELSDLLLADLKEHTEE